MDQNFDLRAYVQRGAERVASEVMRATWKNPRESAFMLRYGASFASASKRRRDVKTREKRGPGWLTLRLGGSGAISGKEWEAYLDAFVKRSISVVLLSGDEPLRYRELLEAAGKKQDILFPVFISAAPDEQSVKLFDRCRNLVPVVDIADASGQALSTMDMLRKKNILFGAFASVTEENLNAVCADARVIAIARPSCKGLLFLDGITREADKAALARDINHLRTAYPEMLFFSMDTERFGGTILHDSKTELDNFLQ